MNMNGLAKRYDTLSPEERFRLILAAGARGDEAEQDRLRSAGRRIGLSIPDHMPWALAFHEVAWISFAELLEEAAKYDDLRQQCLDAARDVPGYFAADGDESNDEGAAGEGQAAERTRADLMFDLLLAQGFMVKVRGDGWKLFCAKVGMPPFALWETMPGLDRVERALERADGSDSLPGPAFAPEGMLRYLNRVRAEQGQPEAPVENLLSAEGIAEALDDVVRTRAKWLE